MFKNVGIYGKAGMALGAILLFAMIIGATALWSVWSIAEETNHVAHRDVVLQDDLARVRNNITVQNAIIMKTLLDFAETRVEVQEEGEEEEESIEEELAENRAAFEAEHQKITERFEAACRLMDAGSQGANDDSEAARFRAWHERLDRIEQTYGEFVVEARAAFAAVAAGNIRTAFAADERAIEPFETRLHAELKALADEVKAGTEESLVHVESAEDAATRTIIAVSLIAVIVGLIATYLVARSVIVPLTRAADIAQEISAGKRDMEIKVDSTDETGRLLAAMRDMLAAINEADREVAEAQAETQKQLDLIQQANIAIREQAEAINELSTPVIRMWEGVLMLPMVGALDTQRSAQMTERLLTAIVEEGSRVAILDVTGVPTIDTAVARHIMAIVDASRILGADVILTGFSADSAQTLAQLGVDFSTLQTAGALQNGILHAFDKIGLRVMR